MIGALVNLQLFYLPIRKQSYTFVSGLILEVAATLENTALKR